MRTAPGTNPVALTGLKIDFLSPVTKPAHEGAVALLLKRADYEPTETEKAEKRVVPGKRRKRKRTYSAKARAETLEAIRKHEHFDQLEKFEDETPVVMTGSIEGHSHLVFMSRRAGETTWQTSAGSESGHDHPWMLTQAGDGTMTIEIGDSEGHSHTVDQTALNAAFAAAALKFDDDTEDPMATKPTTTETTKSAEEIATLETNLALSQIHGSLNDAERSHFATLGTTEKAAFVASSSGDRQAAIKKAAKPGPVEVYKDRDGNSFTDEDDPRLVAAAKRADDAQTRTQKAEDDLNQERLEKRASETLGHLPGSPKSRAALLKSVEGIEDEGERTAALEALTAGNEAIAHGFSEMGSAGGTDAGLGADSPTAKLNKLAEAVASEDKITEAQAFAKVLETAEGKRLYKESVRQ